MAEIVLRDELARAGLAGKVSVESAGTGDWHVGERMYAAARQELARRGYDGSGHRARQIQPSWLASYDLVVAMDRANLAALGQMDPAAQAEGRIRLLRSFDPALAGNDAHHGDVRAGHARRCAGAPSSSASCPASPRAPASTRSSART